MIENSIKYNINNTEILTVHIDVSKKSDKILIRIMDSCKNVSPEMLDKGTGLTATKKRVENAGGTFLITDGGVEISFGHD